ncbi:MAG: EAL domain-containing protein [Nostocales cyanobacterium]|nr:MAG: EAL domain-containing protein [Nostocales cyanobacterium]TAF17077.1 MAG: EAL domain-containing protein [Nostocales cyanobacterium]
MLDNERDKIRHLLVVQDPEGERTIPLLDATYSLGRDTRNAIVLRSKSVSRQHAILLRVTIPGTDNYGFRIIDGNFQGKRSTNGLFINGNKCFSHNLQHGDVIAFGNPSAQAKYYAISNLSEEVLKESFSAADLSKLISQQEGAVNPFDTFIVADTNIEVASDTHLTRLASFPELIPNPIIEMDLDGNITYFNPAAGNKFPKLREIGNEHPILANLVSTIENHPGNSFVREVEIGGEIFEQSVHYLPASDLIRTFIIREITEQKQAEAELKQRDRLLQAVAEAANYLLSEMDYDLAIEKALATFGSAANGDRIYLFQNHPHNITGEMAVSLKFEWTKTGVKSCQEYWQNQTYKICGLERWYTMLSQGLTISGMTQEFPITEREFLERDQIKSLLFVPLRLESGFWGYLGLVDCSQERKWSTHEKSSLMTMAAIISGSRQRQQVEEKIRYQALHDLLTGLPNRLHFNELLDQAIAKSSVEETTLAVMFLDLDRFKMINDTLGHTLGDELLQSVAQRLRQSLRTGDTIARWGGDEFTILLPEARNKQEVAQIAARILLTLEESFFLYGHELYVNASIGVAMLDQHSSNAETLIQHADVALYYAKDKGRNNYQFYQTSLSAKTPELLNLEKSLRHALDRKEFLIYYQPKVNIITGDITGMEALLRWHHPEMGIVAPNVFIPLAEASGLIIPIGEWILKEVCLQNKTWQNAGFPPITVAVNLSPNQFRQPQLVEKVAEILQQTGLEPKYLELEITETTAIENLSFTTTVLKQFEKMGLPLSIDDFGTGYSSLSRLQTLPFHSLKIDRSFIKELTSDKKVAHIVTAIVNLGRSLGLRLIAEGVEKSEELDFLKLIKCDDVQGYFFYKPLSAQQATEIIAELTQKCGN